MTAHNIAYRRVSTLDQNTGRQLDSMTFDAEYEDKASGKDTNRPRLEEMRRHVRAGDTVHVHSIDRLARDTVDLLKLVEEFTGKGVTVRFHSENLTFQPKTGNADKDGLMAELMLTMLGAFAKFERAIILERQREGIAKAKKAGVYKGRKPLDEGKVAAMLARVAEGVSTAAVAKEFGVSRETLYQYLRKPAA